MLDTHQESTKSTWNAKTIFCFLISWVILALLYFSIDVTFFFQSLSHYFILSPLPRHLIPSLPINQTIISPSNCNCNITTSNSSLLPVTAHQKTTTPLPLIDDNLMRGNQFQILDHRKNARIKWEDDPFLQSTAKHIEMNEHTPAFLIFQGKIYEPWYR